MRWVVWGGVDVCVFGVFVVVYGGVYVDVGDLERGDVRDWVVVFVGVVYRFGGIVF